MGSRSSFYNLPFELFPYIIEHQMWSECRRIVDIMDTLVAGGMTDQQLQESLVIRVGRWNKSDLQLAWADEDAVARRLIEGGKEE